MPALEEEKFWLIPTEMKAAYACIYDILAWVDGLAIPDQSKYFVYAALEELLSNKLKYDRGKSGDHPITVQFRITSEVVRVDLADNGQPFDPTAQPDSDVEKSILEGAVGGLGITLVRRICSHMQYRREYGHNHLTLFFNNLKE